MTYLTKGISLLNKTLLNIKGPDATKFLNGLITTRLLPNIVKKKQHTITDAETRHLNLSEIININQNWGLMHEDIYDPNHTISIGRNGINSMFLNSKGRVITDCFLYANPFHSSSDAKEGQLEGNGDYLIEIDPKQESTLLSLLKIHKLSAKVKIKKLELYSYYIYNDSIEFDDWMEDIQQRYFQSMDPKSAWSDADLFIQSQELINTDIADSVIGLAFDNRIPNFGIKIVTNKPIDNLLSAEFTSKFEIEPVDESNITKRRIDTGLFETCDGPSNTSLLPFDCNLDYTNGLSLEKGCYVGQELTIRTYNNGTIRKRIYPLKFHEYEGTNWEVLNNVDLETVTKLVISPLEEPESEQAQEEEQISSPFGAGKSVRKRKSSQGKILSVYGDLGFGLFNIDDVEKNRLYKVELDSGKFIIVEVKVPDWWPESGDSI
ncbi:putative transferase CAF17 mitochondrial [Spathaspora sp. JA1]|nr:putative transferase CAF17 mitochondrial [Spathaspora sp. JA1]